VEALYAQDTNPIVKLLAAEGIRELASSLPQIVESPTDRAARTSALRGAWLCGTCLSSTKTALHHKLCHALGGSLNLPHSETHTIVLPHALAYNIPALSADIIAQIADALPESQGDPLRGLNILLTKLKVKKGLKEYGMKESDIDKVTDIALKNPYWNPRAIEKAPIRELIRRAWAGEEARGDL
jgi:alcohol dehydrogenase class IV